MEIDGGDHARANATFLTGAQARKTAGADVELGISVDQIAAGHVGNLTRLPSLELTCDKPRQAATSRDELAVAIQATAAPINTIFLGSRKPHR